MSYIIYKYCYSLIKNGGNLTSYKTKQNKIHNVLPDFSPVDANSLERAHFNLLLLEFCMDELQPK